MSVVFRLVHLSDLHFSTTPNRLPSPVQTGRLTAVFEALVEGHRGNWFRPASHSTRAARAVARYLATKIIPEESPDVLVVTGDLAATGAVSDLEAARDYLSGSVGAWQNADQEPRLAPGDSHLQVLPGNHDRYHKGTLFPGATGFEMVFAHVWSASPECERVSRPLLVDKGGEALAIICGDFTLRDALHACPPVFGYIGRGMAYEDVVAALVAHTHSVREERGGKVGVIWAVHFPPQFPGGNQNLALQDEQKLISAASDAGIHLLLAGHTHSDCVYSSGSLKVSCVGSATQADAESAWHFSLNEVIVERGVVVGGSVTPFRFDKSRQNFVRESASPI